MTLNPRYLDWLDKLINKNKKKRNFEVATICNTNLFTNNIQEIISRSIGMSRLTYAVNYPLVLLKNLRILITSVMFLEKLLILRDKTRALEIKKNNKLNLLVDIYIPRASVFEGAWLDRMYNDAFSHIDKDEIGYVLTIDFIDQLTSLNKLIQNCPGTFLFPADYLTKCELAKVFLDFIFPPKIVWPQNLLSDDVGRAVRHNSKENRYHRSVFLGLLNKRFIEKVSKITDFDKFIVWHENRCQDRGFISGLRRYCKKVSVVAYQGYLVCRSTYNGYFPNKSDVLLNTAPHTVYVDGRINLNIALINAFNIDFKQGPSLRFSVNKRKQGKTKSDSILVLLPLDALMSRRIIVFVLRSVKKGDKVKFRFHPLSNKTKLLHLFVDYSDIYIEVSSGPLSEDIESSFIAIGSNTSALIESYSHGLPCIGIKLNGEYENIFNTKIAPDTYLLDALGNAKHIIEKYSKKESKERIKTSKHIQEFARLNYMTENTDKIVKEMICVSI